MTTTDIAYCGRRAAEEEQMALVAKTKAAVDAHLALAASYREQILALQLAAGLV